MLLWIPIVMWFQYNKMMKIWLWNSLTAYLKNNPSIWNVWKQMILWDIEWDFDIMT